MKQNKTERLGPLYDGVLYGEPVGTAVKGGRQSVTPTRPDARPQTLPPRPVTVVSTPRLDRRDTNTRRRQLGGTN